MEAETLSFSDFARRLGVSKARVSQMKNAQAPILAYTSGAPKGVEPSNSNEKRTNRSRQLRGFFASRLHAGRVAIRKDARLTFRRFEASRHPLPDAPSNALVEEFEILEKERFMTNTIAPAAGRVAITNGQPTTTTHDIAEVYGKRHDHVLSIVRQRMVEADKWGIPNFWETPYTNPQNGQTYQVIQMTKKGFYFVVGKFTGTKAVRHQIAFADEFERMESELAGGSALSLNQTLRSLANLGYTCPQGAEHTKSKRNNHPVRSGFSVPDSCKVSGGALVRKASGITCFMCSTPPTRLEQRIKNLARSTVMSSDFVAPAAGRVTITNGQPTTTTHDIAEVYGKRHDDVLRIVRQRVIDSGEWGIRNFTETPYTNLQNGQTYQVIQMTKKGFYFVVGKFTGTKAVRHQIAFADEFERMESELAGGSALSLNQTLRSLASQLRQPNGYPASLFAPLVQAYLEKTGRTLADAAAIAATAKTAVPAAGAIPLSAPPSLPGLSVSKLCDAQASAGDCRAITRFWQAYVAGEITGSAALPIPSRLLYWLYERWCADQGVYAAGVATLIDRLKAQHGARVLRKRYQVRSVLLGPHSFVYPRGTTKPAGKCERQWLGSCLQALQTKGGKWKLKL